MANWDNPTITTQYDVYVAETKDRDVDTATLFLNAPTNAPVGCVRWNRSTKIFEEWNGTAWVALVLAVAGGGTSSSNTGQIAGNLGLGTMAYQNSNAINVTGGVATGLTQLWVSCSPMPQSNLTYDLGTLTNFWRNAFIGTGLVIPVGTDKYVVG